MSSFLHVRGIEKPHIRFSPRPEPPFHSRPQPCRDMFTIYPTLNLVNISPYVPEPEPHKKARWDFSVPPDPSAGTAASHRRTHFSRPDSRRRASRIRIRFCASLTNPVDTASVFIFVQKEKYHLKTGTFQTSPVRRPRTSLKTSSGRFDDDDSRIHPLMHIFPTGWHTTCLVSLLHSIFDRSVTFYEKIQSLLQ